MRDKTSKEKPSETQLVSEANETSLRTKSRWKPKQWTNENSEPTVMVNRSAAFINRDEMYF